MVWDFAWLFDQKFIQWKKYTVTNFKLSCGYSSENSTKFENYTEEDMEML